MKKNNFSDTKKSKKYLLALYNTRYRINKSLRNELKNITNEYDKKSSSKYLSIAVQETLETNKKISMRLNNIERIKKNILDESNNSNNVKKLLDEYQNTPNLN